MLKKIFNWKTTSERDRFSTGVETLNKEIRTSAKSDDAQLHQISSTHDRPYHSEADLDSQSRELKNSRIISKARTLSESRILGGFNMLQEVSSTVVCDYGEMDASSPAVQQVLSVT